MKKILSFMLAVLAAVSLQYLGGCGYYYFEKHDDISSGSPAVSKPAPAENAQNDGSVTRIYRETAVLNADDNYSLVYRNNYGYRQKHYSEYTPIADFIIKNTRDIYTLENGIVKKLGKRINVKTCKTAFENAGNKYDLKFDLYEVDGQTYITKLYPTADKIDIDIACTIGENALIHANKHFYLCNVKTGGTEDTFADVYKYLNDLGDGSGINRVVPSDDGTAYILLCGSDDNSSPRVLYFSGTDIVDISAKANMRHNISADAYFTGDKITVLYEFSKRSSYDAEISEYTDDTSYIFYVYDIASGELTRTGDELVANDIETNGRYVYYKKNITGYILDLFTNTTVKAELPDMGTYTVHGLRDKYFCAYGSTGEEALLIDASTGKQLVYVKNKTDCLLSMQGTVIIGRDGKKYLAIYDPSDNIHIYSFDADVGKPEAAYKAGLIQNDDFKYKLISNPYAQNINGTSTVDYILCDDELYTVDYDGTSAKLKPLGIKCNAQTCTAAFKSDGINQRVTFDLYEIDGQIHIGDYDAVPRQYSISVEPLDAERVIIYRQSDNGCVCRVYSVKTGETTDTFADVTEYLSKNPVYNNIHRVIPSQDGKKYIILCGDNHTDYDTIALYYDGRRIVNLGNVCGVKNFIEVNAGFESDTVLLNFTFKTRPTDALYKNRVITNYLYTFNPATDIAKKVCDEITDNQVFFNGRYVTVYKRQENNLTYIIDMLTGKEIKINSGDDTLCYTDSAGDYLFFGYANSASKLIDPSSGEAVYKIQADFESCINGKVLYTARDGKIYILGIDGNNNIHIFKFADA